VNQPEVQVYEEVDVGRAEGVVGTTTTAVEDGLTLDVEGCTKVTEVPAATPEINQLSGTGNGIGYDLHPTP